MDWPGSGGRPASYYNLPVEVRERIYRDIPEPQRRALADPLPIPMSKQAVLDSIEYDTIAYFLNTDEEDLEVDVWRTSSTRIQGKVESDDRILLFTLSFEPYELNITITGQVKIYVYATLIGKVYVIVNMTESSISFYYQVSPTLFIVLDRTTWPRGTPPDEIMVYMLDTDLYLRSSYVEGSTCNNMFVLRIAPVEGAVRVLYLRHLTPFLRWICAWVSITGIDTGLPIMLGSPCFQERVASPPRGPIPQRSVRSI